MNELKYIKIIFCCIVLIVGIRYGCIEPQQVQAESNKSSALDVGRDNPFAKVAKKKTPIPQAAPGSSQSDEDSPELLFETVTLKFLDAKSINKAFECMSSEDGSITIVEESNSLIICDTKEVLETILDEIRKIDKPIPGLLVEAVTLKFLDAKSTSSALAKMSSEHGSITIVEESNSLIICDTPKNLERILTEISKIDKPIPGLLVEAVTLRFLDAKSTKTALEQMSSEYGSISIVERTNALIICDTRKNLEMILTEIGKIDKPASGLLVETINLKFLDAENLKKVLDKMSSPYGSIATNPKSNSLIVCDTKDNLARILTEIRKADKTPEQIMIEVVIVDVQLEDDTEIGVNWDRLFETKRDQAYSQTLIPTTLQTGATFSILKSGISGTLKALQRIRNVEILASPRVLVVSGEEAYIKTVEEIPYKELTESTEGSAGAGNQVTSTKFKEAGITLTVKATVADDRKILMTIEPQQSINTGVAGVGDTTVPIVDKREAKTTLIMEDGQVVVMGGLRRKETKLIRDQVPLLGDLPLVGFLFANNKKVVENSELLVLISPHIYKDEPVPEDVMAKFKEIKDRPLLSLPENKPENKDDAIEELLSILTPGTKKED